MTTDTKGPPPGTASSLAAPAEPGQMVTLSKVLVIATLVALLVGVLSAAGAAYLAGGEAGELDGRVGTLTAQVDTLAGQAASLTAQVATLAGQAASLEAEKADVTDAVADAQAQAESLGEENAALRAQVAGLAPREPVDAQVTFDKAARANSRYLAAKGAFVLVVNVTATNPDAAEDALFDTDDVLLKGPDDTRFPPLDQSPFSSLDDRVHLPGNVVLAPSERVRGRLVFYVPQPVTEFTITYHGTTTALSL